LSHASVTCLLLKLRQSDSLTKGKNSINHCQNPIASGNGYPRSGQS